MPILDATYAQGSLGVQMSEIFESGTSLQSTVDALSQAMIVWDNDNYQHCVHTAAYATAIASELGIDREDAEHVRLGALLHDIGKIGVDLAVVRKPDRLDADERETMRQHPDMGASILERVLPRQIVECAAAHHEQPDGGGYPRGLREGEIPLGALICRVADVFDSLTTRQTYRPALSQEQALAELREGAGTRYGAGIVATIAALCERGALRPAA